MNYPEIQIQVVVGTVVVPRVFNLDNRVLSYSEAIPIVVGRARPEGAVFRRTLRDGMGDQNLPFSYKFDLNSAIIKMSDTEGTNRHFECEWQYLKGRNIGFKYGVLTISRSGKLYQARKNL